MALKRIFNWARRSSLSDATVIATDDESSGSRGITFADLKAIFQVRSEKAANNGYAPLDANGLIPAANLRPALTPEIAADNTALAALTVVSGDIGKRLVHVTATGITWLAMTAGSGSDKWMPYSSEPAASTSAPGIVQLAASSDAETNELKALTLAEFLRRLGPYRNALAPAQALSFNGTAGCTATLTSALGTGATTFSVRFLCPTTTPSIVSGILCVGDFATQDSLQISLSASDRLQFVMQGAGGANYSAYYISAFTATYGGQTVDVVFTRSGTTIAGYVNGHVVALTAVTSAPPLAWDTAITSTAVLLGKLTASNYYFTGPIRLLGIANRALSAAEVLSLYQTGSWPAADFGQGVNDSGTTVYAGAQMINGANSTFASDTGGWTMIGGTNISSGAANFVASSTISRTSILTIGKRYRATFTLTASGGTFKVQDGATFFLTGLTTGAQSFDWTAGGTSFGISSVGATGTVDNLTITPLGLLVAPDPAQPGNGLTWGDRSGNGAHILLPTSGVDWLLPSAAVNKLRGTTSTSGNQQLLGGTTLNANTQITRVRARSRSGTPSITLGTAPGGSQIVADVALSTTWKDLTIALTGGIISTASSVWVGSSADDVVEIDLTHEPLGY